MAKRKYYSVILIILLISVMALAQESTTVNGILANYTELNTSRIFRIYDTSLNEILLSEDGLYLSHVNGGINEIKISSTSTQFSQQIDMKGNDIINCANCDTPDNEKMNKSGDTMTGKLSVNLSVSDTNNSFEFYSGEILRSNLNYQGFQNWYFNVSNTSRGRVAYAQSANRPGIALYGNDGLNRSQFLQKAGGGFEFGFTSASTAPTADITFDVNGNISSVAYAGTGNAYICVDSSGNYYRGTPTC